MEKKHTHTQQDYCDSNDADDMVIMVIMQFHELRQ